MVTSISLSQNKTSLTLWMLNCQKSLRLITGEFLCSNIMSLNVQRMNIKVWAHMFWIQYQFSQFSKYTLAFWVLCLISPVFPPLTKIPLVLLLFRVGFSFLPREKTQNKPSACQEVVYFGKRTILYKVFLPFKLSIDPSYDNY